MIEKVLIGPADRFHIDGIMIYDDESLGFDYQGFHKSIGFDEDKIYPRDKEHVEDKKTLSEVDGSQGSKLFMRNKNVKVKKSLHWKPFLEYYCNHEYWNIEYKKFLKTLPYYKKVFSKFNFGHISDNESWNNWLFS